MSTGVLSAGTPPPPHTHTWSHLAISPAGLQGGAGRGNLRQAGYSIPRFLAETFTDGFASYGTKNMKSKFDAFGPKQFVLGNL